MIRPEEMADACTLATEYVGAAHIYRPFADAPKDGTKVVLVWGADLVLPAAFAPAVYLTDEDVWLCLDDKSKVPHGEVDADYWLPYPPDVPEAADLDF